MTTETSNAPAADQQAAENTPVFAIDKLYVKDISLEVPNAPQVFLESGTPSIDIELHTGANNLGEGFYEAVLTITVTAKVEDKVMFLAEVGQAGIFQIRNVPTESLSPLLGIAAPQALFPYAREVVSDITNRAGFPPVILAPVNFEALYAARQQEAVAAAAAAQNGTAQ